jgi:ubiquitin fusion degradation protein 1
VFREIHRLKMSFPLVFRISISISKSHRDYSGGKNRSSRHVGVYDFTAQEGLCYIPQWMMNNFHIHKDCFVTIQPVRTATSETLESSSKLRIPKGVHLELEEIVHIDFHGMDIRDVLENALRKYTFLYQHEEIPIDVAGERFFIRVKSVLPLANDDMCISLLGDLDISVDFQPIRNLGVPSLDEISEDMPNENILSDQRSEMSKEDMSKLRAEAAIRRVQAVASGHFEG